MSSARRQLAFAVLACLVGSCLALFATTRTWVVTVHARPAPQPAHLSSRTGVSEVPWAYALALVGLAGAGALLAARNGARVLVGMLVSLAGAGVLLGGVLCLATVSRVSVPWSLLCVLAGALVAGGGGLAALRARDWPTMGARYDRPRHPDDEPVVDQVQRIGPSPSDVAMWDALDRGEDPTRRGD